MPMKPARLALLPLLVSTLLLGACQESEQQAEQQQQQQTPTVGVVTLKAEHFLLTNDLPGRTTAYRIAEEAFGNTWSTTPTQAASQYDRSSSQGGGSVSRCGTTARVSRLGTPRSGSG